VCSSDLNDLLAEADILVIALPLTRRTRGLIDAKAIGGMKPGSFLVNISRGEVVDEAALYEALAGKRLGGAAIDTWYRYPTAESPEVLPSQRFPFEKLDNLVMSPHRAGFSEGELPHLADAAENLNRLAAGRPLINQIDLEAQY
jgi:phosphoglycerate dehydrogenase-like enzyme